VEDPDIALMARIRSGDTEAFEELLSRHHRSVYNLACRFLNDPADAEDVTQEVFIRVLKASKTYSPEAKFTTWLYTIVKNFCFNVLRKRQSVRILSLDDETVPDVFSRSLDPSELLLREQERNRVIKAVMALPENLRFAVILQKFHGLSCKEISEVLNCSVNAVKIRIHRAKEFLADELKKTN
jgi:RNA polymerase sigma-70 factor (ECF subfamily)